MLRIAYENVWDLGTVSASSEDPNFPAVNTQNRLHTKTWRSSSVTGTEWIKIDLGEAKDVNVFFLRFNNFSQGATVVLKGNTTDDWTAADFQASLNVRNDLMSYYFPGIASFRYWRLEITDAGNADGYVEVGRVFLGTYKELGAISWGVVHRLKDESILELSEGGQLSAIRFPVFREIEYTLKALTLEQRNILINAFMEKGLSGDIFVTEDPSDYENTTYYVRFATEPRITEQAYGYTTKLRFEELR